MGQGMENPIFTFATPTVISGDRQNVDVIARTYMPKAKVL